MPTKADLKRLSSPPKVKFRQGDKVVIIAGKDKGQKGYIAVLDPKEQKAIVLQDDPENPAIPAAAERRRKAQEGEVSGREVVALQDACADPSEQLDGARPGQGRAFPHRPSRRGRQDRSLRKKDRQDDH